MSDGSLNDLKQAIDFYVGAGNSNPNLDKEIHGLDFLDEHGRRRFASLSQFADR
jgi:hypothetical protein